MANWRQKVGAWISGERKSSSLELFREIYGGRSSRSGATVTAQSALEVSTVLACCRVIANGVAQVPWRIYHDTGDGKKTLAKEHSLYRLLYRRPNRWQTSFEFRETIMFHVLLGYNAYVFVNRVGIARKIIELVPIEPARVEVKLRDDQAIEYRVSDGKGGVQVFGADAIWHIRGPSWNGWVGMDGLKLAREAIGLSITLEQGQAEFQKNGAQTSGVLSPKDKLSPEQYNFLAVWLDKHMPGGDRFGKPLIVDGGATYTNTSMTAIDQQLVESRKHQIEEICRGFGVMPLMVGHPADMAARAATESIFLHHVIHCLTPHYERIEQSADVNLLSEADLDGGLYTKFTPNALMRGAAKDRAEYFAKALGSGGTKGWLTQNQVRALEEMDRDDDPEADKLPQPIAAKAVAPPKEPAEEPDDPDGTGDDNAK